MHAHGRRTGTHNVVSPQLQPRPRCRARAQLRPPPLASRIAKHRIHTAGHAIPHADMSPKCTSEGGREGRTEGGRGRHVLLAAVDEEVGGVDVDACPVHLLVPCPHPTRHCSARMRAGSVECLKKRSNV
eukprot:3941687-Rhodomonas_salina.3